MPKFGERSKQRLEGEHPDLIAIFEDVIKIYNITILKDGGARTRERQAALFAKGATKTMKSLHLPQEDGFAHAVDAAPYPVDWNDRERFYYMNGLIRMAAEKRGIKIRQGHDWDGDGDFKDQRFDDLPHTELPL